MSDLNSNILLVEGKNDQHVIWALCASYQVSELFQIEIPKVSEGGVESLIDSISTRIDRADLRTLGIIVDADNNLNQRWQQVRTQLMIAGFHDTPINIPTSGLIVEQENLYTKRVGIWIMPNNETNGKLEDFVRFLIDDYDLLQHDVEQFLAQIEAQKHHKYREVDHVKAFIHTWLACQKQPGQPMGQAITAKALRSDSPIAQQFVSWLRQLFTL